MLIIGIPLKTRNIGDAYRLLGFVSSVLFETTAAPVSLMLTSIAPLFVPI